MSKQSKALREKSVVELQALLKTTQNDLVGVRFGVAMRQETNVAQLRLLRRSVARIKTLLHEHELFDDGAAISV